MKNEGKVSILVNSGHFDLSLYRFPEVDIWKSISIIFFVNHSKFFRNMGSVNPRTQSSIGIKQADLSVRLAQC